MINSNTTQAAGRTTMQTIGNFLSVALVLALASSAKADPIYVDPGSIGGPAGFSFTTTTQELESGADIFFSEMKFVQTVLSPLERVVLTVEGVFSPEVIDPPDNPENPNDPIDRPEIPPKVPPLDVTTDAVVTYTDANHQPIRVVSSGFDLEGSSTLLSSPIVPSPFDAGPLVFYDLHFEVPELTTDVPAGSFNLTASWTDSLTVGSDNLIPEPSSLALLGLGGLGLAAAARRRTKKRSA